MKTKTKIPHLILAGLFGTSLASQAAVLYQSDFTGTTVGDADLEVNGANSGTWNIDTVNDRLRYSAPFSTSRTTVNNTVGYGLEPGYKGYTLDVTFNQLGSGTTFTIGLVDADDTWNWNNDFLDTVGQPYAIAFQTDGSSENANSNDDVLMFHNESTTTALSDAQGDITYGQDTTLSITVTADSFSYSLNGAPATTGAITFDTSKNYMFAAYANRGTAANGSYISNITITAIPEPSSGALLGLGGLALALRRRRS